MNCAVCGEPVLWDFKTSSLYRPLCWSHYYDRAAVPRGMSASEAAAAWDFDHPTIHGRQEESEGISMVNMTTTKLARDRALAFVHALDRSPKVKAHLEALLGVEGPPTVEDFRAVNAKAVDRCGKFLAHLAVTTHCLEDVHYSRPRQSEIKLSEGEERKKRKPEKKASLKKKAAKAKAEAAAPAKPSKKAKASAKPKGKSKGPRLIRQAVRKVLSAEEPVSHDVESSVQPADAALAD